MAQECRTCGSEITDGGLIKAANYRLTPSRLAFINFMDETAYEELCGKCGEQLWADANARVNGKIAELQEFLKRYIVDFPMMTLGQMPEGAKYKVKTMITANVTVGTGFFNEFSQGISDMFGALNTESGMAYKVNSGEAAARSILANKAMNLGANCVIGVDIDYGTTANNAATINMQGTAVLVSNLNEILDEQYFIKAQQIRAAYDGVLLRQGWLRGEFGDGPD